MPASFWPVCKNYLEVCWNLPRQDSECIVYWGALEHTQFQPFLITMLGIRSLQDHRDALCKEDETDDREQQSIVDRTSKYLNEASDGKRSCITHEYLCWKGIVPKESN